MPVDRQDVVNAIDSVSWGSGPFVTADAAIKAVLDGLMKPSGAMLDIGEAAIDNYFNGTKDADFLGSLTAAYKAILIAERARLFPNEGAG